MNESLTKHLPELEKGATFGEWIIDRESTGIPDDPIRMLYVNYGP